MEAATAKTSTAPEQTGTDGPMDPTASPFDPPVVDGALRSPSKGRATPSRPRVAIASNGVAEIIWQAGSDTKTNTALYACTVTRCR
jgi:hypothetical protein